MQRMGGGGLLAAVEDSALRFPLPVRTRQEMDADSDSEVSDSDLDMKEMLKRFKAISSKGGDINIDGREKSRVIFLLLVSNLKTMK